MYAKLANAVQAQQLLSNSEQATGLTDNSQCDTC